MCRGMFGACPRLLASWLLIVLPTLLAAQSDRATKDQPDLSRDIAALLSKEGPTGPTKLGGPFHVPLPRHGTFGFREFARAAGTIFSGTVTSVARRPATANQAIETVAITFHVERAIRGAMANEELTIQQWIGVWSGGQRYRVGERVLLFLYSPSKLGLTSSVGGSLGRFSIDPRGRVRFSAQHLSAFHADPVLGGRSHASLSEFAAAVERAAGSEEQ